MTIADQKHNQRLQTTQSALRFTPLALGGGVFNAWRQDRLWQKIQRVTGATEAADLEANGEERG